MISAIAHQWRQPINVLGLYIQSVFSDFESGDISKESLAEFKNDSLDLIKHMSETIDDFRGFFRPDKEIVGFDVADEIVGIVKLIDAQLAMRHINVDITCECRESNGCKKNLISEGLCSCGLTKIKGYPGEFKQALVNIIYNAVDAITENIQKGNVDSGQIDIQLKAEKNNICIYIYDNGTGISEDIKSKKIFDPYYTTKPEGKGTGIGLYMTKLVIEEHMKGSIMAENTDRGACMVIQFPS